MKKTYSQPECIIAILGTCKMMAESMTMIIDNSSENVISNYEDILTKENKDVNLWDSQW